MRPPTDHEIAIARRALDRAYAEGVHARLSRVEGHGRYQTIAHYHAPLGDRYTVLLNGCTCAAGLNQRLCKHQVALADLTGQLDLFIPNAYGDAEDVA